MISSEPQQPWCIQTVQGLVSTYRCTSQALQRLRDYVNVTEQVPKFFLTRNLIIKMPVSKKSDICMVETLGTAEVSVAWELISYMFWEPQFPVTDECFSQQLRSLRISPWAQVTYSEFTVLQDTLVYLI